MTFLSTNIFINFKTLIYEEDFFDDDGSNDELCS